MKNKFFTLILLTTMYSFISCGSDNDLPSEPIKVVIEGAEVSPEVGGPNQPNQVYIDLSTNTTTEIKRDSWDLGFYSGSEFRVVINGSISMAAAKLSTTDIDAVSSSTQEVKDLQPLVRTNTYTDESAPFVDHPSGDITKTAIAEIEVTEANNKVYLVNLGYEVATDKPATGSYSANGDERGWKKIRVLKEGDAYVLQYADLDATTHKEIVITKTEGYHFTFFSFNTEAKVNVEPMKENWDLNFTIFTDLLPSYGPYVYADFVVNNIKSNVKGYMIDTEKENYTYNDFTLTDVKVENFGDTQTVIGKSWRVGGGPSSLPSRKDNVFYVIEDTDGNLYKLKLLALTNDAGERGYPEFVYSLLK
ncbi:HmuY family protein [Tenacibaculum mesophilum]|uniref:HmuY family protein n=1 Tax=Tenacibaculum mesophilum TaxID=104268 RepID=UPI003748800A